MATIPTFAEARDFLIALGKALFPDRNYGNAKSYHSRRAAFLAGAQTQLHAQIKAEADNAMPDTAADGVPINRWGEEVLGIERKSATPARGTAAGRVRGTAATPVVAGEELTHPSSGLRYKIGTTTAVGGGGTVDVDIVAIDTGARTKLDAGQVLRFVNTPVGLETNVTLVADVADDGYDDEPYGAYRDRVLSTFSDRSSGGNQSDYVDWMLEIEGVSSAFAYGNRAGMGSVDVIALHTGSGSDRELDAGEQAEVLAYIRTKAPLPIAAPGGPLRYLDAVIQEVDVEMTIEPNGESAYAFDWDDGGTPPVVLAWEPGGVARKLQFAGGARPASMTAGHRIVIRGVASAQKGEVMTIEALSGVDSVILEDVPDVSPAATDVVYPAGPLTEPIRSAIVAHMNGETVYAGRDRVPTPASSLDSTLGLEVLTTGIGPANPSNTYGTWQGDLILAVLESIAMYKRGVRNVTTIAPAADVEGDDPSFPDDDTKIGLIAPGAVLVRPA